MSGLGTYNLSHDREETRITTEIEIHTIQNRFIRRRSYSLLERGSGNPTLFVKVIWRLCVCDLGKSME